jgi:hypothetical protein
MLNENIKPSYCWVECHAAALSNETVLTQILGKIEIHCFEQVADNL